MSERNKFYAELERKDARIAELEEEVERLKKTLAPIWKRHTTDKQCCKCSRPFYHGAEFHNGKERIMKVRLAYVLEFDIEKAPFVDDDGCEWIDTPEAEEYQALAEYVRNEFEERLDKIRIDGDVRADVWDMLYLPEDGEIVQDTSEDAS